MKTDYLEIATNISLHGLGFIQLKLPGNQRLHVWHPELPRRKCYDYSSIHNHRFSFTSRVIAGVQVNQRVDIEIVKNGTCELISHNGPRTETGSRLSYPVAECNIHLRPIERLGAGQEYFTPMFEYHRTIPDGIVITIMKKHDEGKIHANSVIMKPQEFDYKFDRFQLPENELYSYVIDAFKGAK